uniref:Uncharacterized protein n=1 Tax=viral metagenome TaxID=1070528 RepID=A0A6M3JNM7_9ZZZZ
MKITKQDLINRNNELLKDLLSAQELIAVLKSRPVLEGNMLLTFMTSTEKICDALAHTVFELRRLKQ